MLEAARFKILVLDVRHVNDSNTVMLIIIRYESYVLVLMDNLRSKKLAVESFDPIEVVRTDHNMCELGRGQDFLRHHDAYLLRVFESRKVV